MLIAINHRPQAQTLKLLTPLRDLLGGTLAQNWTLEPLEVLVLVAQGLAPV